MFPVISIEVEAFKTSGSWEKEENYYLENSCKLRNDAFRQQMALIRCVVGRGK